MTFHYLNILKDNYPPYYLVIKTVIQHFRLKQGLEKGLLFFNKSLKITFNDFTITKFISYYNNNNKKLFPLKKTKQNKIKQRINGKNTKTK